jgi:hypothetical protein
MRAAPRAKLPTTGYNDPDQVFDLLSELKTACSQASTLSITGELHGSDQACSHPDFLRDAKRAPGLR